MLRFDSDDDSVHSSQLKATRTFGEEAIVPVTPPEVELVAPTPAIGLGQTPEIPNYTFVRELTTDATAPTYEVLRHEDSLSAILQTFPLQQWASVEERVAFRRILEGLAKIRHTHIAEILDVAENDGLPFLVVAQTQGETLDKLAKGRPHPPKFVANLGELLAKTLAVVHGAGSQLGKVTGAGTQHGKLTPKSIRLENTSELVSRQGQVPFGDPKIEGLHLNAIPKAHNNPEADLQTGQDFCYSAPEVVSNPAAISPQSDLYSLGAILYELLTGRPPLVACTYAEYQELVKQKPVVKPSDLVSGINETLDHIILRCLEKSPQRRYPDGEHLAEDLIRYLKNQPVSVNKSSVWQTPVRSPHRSRFFWGVCLGLVISFGLLWWGSGGLFDRKQPSQVNNELAKSNIPLPSDSIDTGKPNPSPEPKNLQREHLTITRQIIEQLNTEAETASNQSDFEATAKSYLRVVSLLDSISNDENPKELGFEKAQTSLKLATCYAKARRYDLMEQWAKKSLKEWHALSETIDPQKIDPLVLANAFQSFTVVVPKDSETELYQLSEQFVKRIRTIEPTSKQHQSLSMLLRMRAGYFCTREMELAEKAIRDVTLYANDLLAHNPESNEAKAFHQQALLIDAQFCLRIGDLVKGEARFNQILAPANAKNTPLVIRVDALLGCAEIFYRERNPRNAETYLTTARTLGPCERNINQMYGRLVVYHLDIDHREQAYEFAQKVLQSLERDRGLCVAILREFLRSYDYDSTKSLALEAIEQKVFEKKFLREFLEREPEYPIWSKNTEFANWLRSE